MEFQTQVAGIPCICKVIDYVPPRPMHVYGSGWGDADPPTDGEFDYEILDRKGYRASWLEKKLTPHDKDRLLEEFELEMTGERYGYLT